MKSILKKLRGILNGNLRKMIAYIYSIFESCYHESNYINYRKKYDIPPTFRFNGKGIVFYGDGKIYCGEKSYIGEYSSVQSSDGYKVLIGNNCSISHFVMIYTSNSVADQDFSKERGERDLSYGDVIVGDNCWIGARVFITENTKIGENSVIGANSVVTRDIPPNSIAGGYLQK